MKFLKKLVIKKHLKSLGSLALKVVDHAALGGAVSKTIQETDGSPKGKIPYLEVIASLVPVVLLIALFAGWIDIAQLKELLKMF